MDKELEQQLLEKVGVDAAKAAKAEIEKAEARINAQAQEFAKGLMTQKDFDAFKLEQLEPVNAILKTLDAASKEQGNKINQILEKGVEGRNKSIEEFAIELWPKIMECKQNGKYMEFTGAQLKAAGVNSVTGAVPTASPYIPGIGGPDLQFFDVVRNPSFITSKVDLGRTNQSILAWANELDVQGAPTLVAEAAAKPLTQHRFAVETSQAKKIAGYVQITDEFEQDIPQFGTLVRRMLQVDVERAFDDNIQAAVIAAARPYEITGLNASIDDANYWDALLSMRGQIGYYNFLANTVGLNYLTDVLVQTEKASTFEYLLPPFVDELNKLKVFANKLAIKYALVGDLKQYKVDIYKDFMFKVGWINDDLIHNQFAVVGEMRFHSYISDNRKKAIVYDNLDTVTAAINKSV